MNRARILSRAEQRVSPWVSLVCKDVDFDCGDAVQSYHCLAQADYVTILAQTRGGLIPVVRQYRPAVEAYTWELPAGLLEAGEDPAAACRRELKEETGLDVQSLTYFGSYYPDTGRLQNRLHAFFASTSEPDPAFVPEPGLSVAFVAPRTLREYILDGRFRHQLHLAVLTLASLWKDIDWDFGES